jgi:hypothetical protein
VEREGKLEGIERRRKRQEGRETGGKRKKVERVRGKGNLRE